jgi:hypothetical protein
MSNTFAGIYPGNAIQFAVAEVIGAFIGLALYQLLSSEADHRHSTR